MNPFSALNTPVTHNQTIAEPEELLTAGISLESKPKILVLTPDLRNICGVSNYFNTIRLDESMRGLDYFFVNNVNKENAFYKLKRLILNYVFFIKKLVQNKYDLVHINPSFNKNSFLRDAVFCYIASFFQIKMVIFFRGWDDKFEDLLYKKAYLRLLFNYTYRRCPNYIVLGQSFKNKLIKLGVDPAKTKFWVESTVANSNYLPEFSIDKKLMTFNDEINLLFISRIVKSKGTYTAIKAFDILRNENPHLKINFTVAGDGKELESVKQYVKQNDIQSVSFLGFVKGDQKKEVLLKSHILIFPTEYGEGLPNCILEGMLYGMPIISRYNGAISDVVTHEENGFLTESVDPITFSVFLEKLVKDKSLYSKMAINNHSKALNNFTKERVKTRVLDIYEELLTNNIKKSA